MSIRRLPIELVSWIARYLDVDDHFNWSMTCRQYQFLIKDQSICRNALEFHAPYSQEIEAARISGNYARQLRLMVKRKEATCRSEPYSAALLGVAESFVFRQGLLAYTVERWQVRLLDLTSSRCSETVINTRKLLDEVIPDAEGTTKYKFQVLHYSDGILSCLYTHCVEQVVTSWLIVLDRKNLDVLATRELDSAYRIFVRNDADFLVYGTHSETSEEDYTKRWALRVLNIQEGTWYPHKIVAADLIGNDIDGKVCFEVIEGHFYGVSNTCQLEADDVTDTVSHYYAFRFPLHAPLPRNTAITHRQDMFRCVSSEGIQDCRWSYLRLVKDARNGDIIIIEGRKELLPGYSTHKRSYYRTELKFRMPMTGYSDIDDTETNQTQINQTQVSAGDNDPYDRYDSSRLQITPVLCELPARRPAYVQRADAADDEPLFVFSEVPIRCYFPSYDAWVDLVNDRAVGSWAPRLRLRTGSRRLRASAPPQEPESERLRAYQGQQPVWPDEDAEIAARYEQNENKLWPRLPGTAGQGGVDEEERLASLYSVLNPPQHEGDVSWALDGHNLVYATGPAKDKTKLQALVLLSWDPGVRIEGLRSWRRGGCGPARQTGEHVSQGGKWMSSTPCGIPASGSAVQPTILASSGSFAAAGSSPDAAGCGSRDVAPWVTVERPMYLDIPASGEGPFGYWFGHEEEPDGSLGEGPLRKPATGEP